MKTKLDLETALAALDAKFTALLEFLSSQGTPTQPPQPEDLTLEVEKVDVFVTSVDAFLQTLSPEHRS